jgi:acyl-CoA reductase-like NAD-dependent aldehyde dehydrogenase
VHAGARLAEKENNDMNEPREGQLFIDGEWRAASDGGTFEVINPADESFVGTAADATADDVADAVGAARTAFDTTTWSTDTDFRRKCLQQLSAGLRKASGELAQIATLEAGIPSNQGYLIDSVIEEVEWTIALMGTFGWEVDLPPFEMLGLRSNRRVRQEARGVVGAITPWNAPTSMNVGKAAPALAAGNTVVLKPAPDTPLSAVILAEIIANHTDIPPGVFPYSVGMCMYNSGQGCVLPTRMVVHASRYDEVLERAVAVTQAISWGDPRDPATVVGPIIRRGQLERMAGLVDRAREEGAKVAVGGRISDRFGKGFWYEPTVVTGVDVNSEIAQTEVFGPVLTILKYDGDDDEAIRIANATKYGLGAFVQTANPGRAWKIAHAVRSGGVAIGPSFWVAADTPFGGYGASGLGRERGVEGFLEFLQAKAISTPAAA